MGFSGLRILEAVTMFMAMARENKVWKSSSSTSGCGCGTETGTGQRCRIWVSELYVRRLFIIRCQIISLFIRFMRSSLSLSLLSVSSDKEK